MLLPLGTFEVKYATGTGEYWCGQDAKFPFGRQTQFFRADDIFDFTDEGDHYSGYTLELFLQPDGNMQTVSLAADEWWSGGHLLLGAADLFLGAAWMRCKGAKLVQIAA
jgi:hypothetical protein